MTCILPALVLGLAIFAADTDPEPPKPKPKDVSAQSPDKRVTAIAADKLINVKDNQTGKLILSIRAHVDTIVSLSYSPDGKLLASADKSGNINVLDPATGAALWKLKTGLEGAGKLAYSKDGRQLSWTVGKKVKTIEAGTGKVVQ